MMNAYIVTAWARGAIPDRHIDSIWISEESAQKRKQFLAAEFERLGASNPQHWRAWVTEVQIEDAAEAPKRSRSPTAEERKAQ